MFKYDNNIKLGDFLGANCTQKIAAINVVHRIQEKQFVCIEHFIYKTAKY